MLTIEYAIYLEPCKGVRTFDNTIESKISSALLLIQKETTKLNTLILAVKTIHILSSYDSTLENEVNNISDMLFNDFEVCYNVFIRGLDCFSILNEYSVFELLTMMNISKVASFYLITSLCLCNDIKLNRGCSFNIDCSEFALKRIHRKFFEEIYNNNCFIRYLINDNNSSCSVTGDV